MDRLCKELLCNLCSVNTKLMKVARMAIHLTSIQNARNTHTHAHSHKLPYFLVKLLSTEFRVLISWVREI